jgi:hypothetical protein
LLTRSSFIWLSLALLLAAAISLLLPLGAASSITIEWTTASELNTAGFNLYRSEGAAGNYLRLNTELIPGSTDSLTGGTYSYIDTNVIAGRTYYYQLEDIETSGATTRHEPYQVVAGAGSNISGLTIGLLGAGLLTGLIGLTDRKRAAHG